MNPQTKPKSLGCEHSVTLPFFRSNGPSLIPWSSGDRRRPWRLHLSNLWPEDLRTNGWFSYWWTQGSVLLLSSVTGRPRNPRRKGRVSGGECPWLTRSEGAVPPHDMKNGPDGRGEDFQEKEQTDLCRKDLRNHHAKFLGALAYYLACVNADP